MSGTGVVEVGDQAGCALAHAEAGFDVGDLNDAVAPSQLGDKGFKMSTPDDARSWLEAAQRLVGISWSRMIALIGPAVCSVWFYGQFTGTTNQSADYRSPLDVAAGLLAHFDATTSSISDFQAWLHGHAELSTPAFVVSVVMACLAARSPATAGSWLTIASLLMLLVIELRGPWMIAALVAVTLCFMAIAIWLDRRAEAGWSENWISIPELSVKHWVMGPGALVWFPVFLPLFVIAGMVEAFRVERRIPDQPAYGAPVVNLRGPSGDGRAA